MSDEHSLDHAAVCSAIRADGFLVQVQVVDALRTVMEADVSRYTATVRQDQNTPPQCPQLSSCFQDCGRPVNLGRTRYTAMVARLENEWPKWKENKLFITIGEARACQLTGCLWSVEVEQALAV